MLFIKYYDDQVVEDETDRACSKQGDMINIYTILAKKSERKKNLPVGGW